MLARHSVGTYQEMSSHATCQGKLSRSHLSLPGVHELISTSKNSGCIGTGELNH